jgi:hypothetical protein
MNGYWANSGIRHNLLPTPYIQNSLPQPPGQVESTKIVITVNTKQTTKINGVWFNCILILNKWDLYKTNVPIFSPIPEF